jgi:hypothetical protein
MRLTIDIPDPNDVVSKGCPVPLAPDGTRWSESCLGKNAKETGVYVIHHAGIIKYVGKTDSPSMSYGMRLRREFQESASSGKHNYPKLSLLRVPPDVMVSFFPATAINALVQAEGVTLDIVGKIQVFEIALAHAYDPEFQQHHAERVRKYLKKRQIPEEAFDMLLKVQKKG